MRANLVVRTCFAINSFHVHLTAQAQNAVPRIFASLTYQTSQNSNALFNLLLLLVIITLMWLHVNPMVKNIQSPQAPIKRLVWVPLQVSNEPAFCCVLFKIPEKGIQLDLCSILVTVFMGNILLIAWTWIAPTPRQPNHWINQLVPGALQYRQWDLLNCAASLNQLF